MLPRTSRYSRKSGRPTFAKTAELQPESRRFSSDWFPTDMSSCHEEFFRETAAQRLPGGLSSASRPPVTLDGAPPRRLPTNSRAAELAPSRPPASRLDRRHDRPERGQDPERRAGVPRGAQEMRQADDSASARGPGHVPARAVQRHPPRAPGVQGTSAAAARAAPRGGSAPPLVSRPPRPRVPSTPLGTRETMPATRGDLRSAKRVFSTAVFVFERPLADTSSPLSAFLSRIAPHPKTTTARPVR